MVNDVHRLKLVQPYFDDVVSGAKTFEVRVNDRDFKVGDVLELLEYNPETTWLTDRSVRVRVTYILDNPNYVLPGTVIMAIERVGADTDKQEQMQAYDWKPLEPNTWYHLKIYDVLGRLIKNEKRKTDESGMFGALPKASIFYVKAGSDTDAPE